jgi:hypothetical protein
MDFLNQFCWRIWVLKGGEETQSFHSRSFLKHVCLPCVGVNVYPSPRLEYVEPPVEPDGVCGLNTHTIHRSSIVVIGPLPSFVVSISEPNMFGGFT